MVFLLPAVHRKLFGVAAAAWYRRTLWPFLALGCISFALPKIAVWSWWAEPTPALQFMALGAAILIYILLGYYQLGMTIRSDIKLMVGSVTKALNGRRA
jgi:hypothetical protein